MYSWDHYIIELGPIVNGRYEWAMVYNHNVIDSYGVFLGRVIARDPENYYKLYEKEVKKKFRYHF